MLDAIPEAGNREKCASTYIQPEKSLSTEFPGKRQTAAGGGLKRPGFSAIAPTQRLSRFVTLLNGPPDDPHPRPPPNCMYGL